MKLRHSLRDLGILVTGMCIGMGMMKMEGCDTVRRHIERLLKEEAPPPPPRKPEKYRRSTASADSDTPEESVGKA